VAGRPRMVAGRLAHVAKAPPFYPKGVVVELKRETAEGNGGEEREGGRLVSHPVLRPKPNAHRMYAQDQVVIHTTRM
jgi:hypothetical protein